MIYPHEDDIRRHVPCRMIIDAITRSDANTLAVIGADSQAAFDIEAVAKVRKLEHVITCRRNPDKGAILAQYVRAKLGIDASLAVPETTVPQADIVVTVTPSTEQVLDEVWIREGTHISAMVRTISGSESFRSHCLSGRA
jgi:ornithine cyclodeaminase